ncbi:hypothetical protein EDD16DRAFT_1171083 [Pisolithus croceorrhizus]|nr:hypothetical protein EDD16DRAFT_1171083 [Pisolithus croceorrhizus]
MPNIERVSTDYFLIRVLPGTGEGDDEVLVHREQVRSFFQYDRALRRNADNLPELPAGYHQFRDAYSREAKTRSRFAYVDAPRGKRPRVIVPGPSPTREEVLGQDSDLRSQESNNSSEYSADFSPELHSFFDQVDPLGDILPNQPIAGPSRVTLDQSAVVEAYASEIGNEEDEAYDVGAEGTDDQALDPDVPAGHAA